MAELPNRRTHRVLAEVPLPAPVDDVVTVGKALCRKHRKAVVITDGPLWKDGYLVFAVELSRPLIKR